MSSVLAVVVSGCTQVKTEAIKPIRIALNVWPGYAYAFIAKEMGFFKKNRVDVDLILKREITESDAIFKYGETDGTFTTLPNVINMNDQGVLCRIVFVCDYSVSGDVVIAKPEFNSMADLKGKTVSFEGLNSFSHIFVLKLLENAGIKESDMRFKIVYAHDVLSALEKGEIDAGHTWDPTKAQSLQKGYKILGQAGDVPGIITDVLVFRTETIEKRPEDIRGIIKSLLDAKDFLESNREEALKIMADTVGMTKEEMAQGIRGVFLLDIYENFEALRESKNKDSLYSMVNVISNFYINRGQLSRIPDFGKIIEPKFVKEVYQGMKEN